MRSWEFTLGRASTRLWDEGGSGALVIQVPETLPTFSLGVHVPWSCVPLSEGWCHGTVTLPEGHLPTWTSTSRWGQGHRDKQGASPCSVPRTSRGDVAKQEWASGQLRSGREWLGRRGRAGPQIAGWSDRQVDPSGEQV